MGLAEGEHLGRLYLERRHAGRGRRRGRSLRQIVLLGLAASFILVTCDSSHHDDDHAVDLLAEILFAVGPCRLVPLTTC